MIDDFAPFGKNKQKPVPVFSEDNLESIEEVDSYEPNFRPPENFEQSNTVTSNSDTVVETGPNSPETANSKKHHKRKSRFGKLKDKLPKLTKKQWLIVISLAIVLLAGLGYITWKTFFNQKPQQATVPAVQPPKSQPKPTTAPSKLTGVQVSIADSELPVTAIMIENSPDARPQSGLKDAGVVYEAVAEGGITRFLTLFQEAKPDYIGPVRSVRPYYLDWLVPFDAPVAHVGGSGEALAQIRAEGIKDLDYAFNSNYFHRVSNRYAPHNVYTSRAEMLELQKSKGWSTSKFSGWARKEDKPVATPNAKSIDFAISGFLYNPHYDYDATTNSYKRSEAGKPHIDEKSGAQINPKVVIAIVVPKSVHGDGVHTVYGSIGNGKAYFFQDGTVTEGIWEKQSRQSEMRFGDINGSPLSLNKGNTWISVVGESGAVTFTP